MIVRVVTPPEPLLTWAEAKAHLRIDGDEERTYVEALIGAASAWVDGPDGWLGRSIGEQLLELVSPSFGCDALPFGPIVDIDSVSYLDEGNVERVLADDEYRLMPDRRLLPAINGSWPSLASSSDAVRVRFVVGYPDTVEGDSTVPKPIKQALLLLIGHWYANRESVVTGTITASLPLATEALLSTYRVWSV